MSPLEAAKALLAAPIGVACDFCTGSSIGGHFEECPMIRMPAIVAALESRERMIASMARVWGKVQSDVRAEYKQYVEMGDLLYHETNGEQGACGQYDGPPCSPDEVPA